MFHQNESLYKNIPKFSGLQHQYHICVSYLKVFRSAVVVLFQAVGPVQGCHTDFPFQGCQPNHANTLEKEKEKASAFIHIPLTNTLHNQAQYQWIMKMSLPTPERDPEKSHGQGHDT